MAVDTAVRRITAMQPVLFRLQGSPLGESGPVCSRVSPNFDTCSMATQIDLSRKINHNSPGTPIFAWCPGFVPTLPICSRIDRWPKISSDFIRIYKKSLAAGAPPRPRWELMTLPHPSSQRCSPLRLVPSALVQDCGA